MNTLWKCMHILHLLVCSFVASIAQPVNTRPAFGIEPVPSSLGPDYTSHFDRYTKVVAPNGGSIHIVAQSTITNEQIIRCRSILEHYLTNYPGSRFGSDKNVVANAMAKNGAILTLLDGEDDGNNPVHVNGQALYKNEIQVEGHPWYVQQEYTHRDASFEEILHFVHDYGIGVDGPNSNPGAAPDFQKEIRKAQINALHTELWGMGKPDWLAELKAENSLSQEYLAAVVDSYYGLWGAWSGNSSHSMWGIYVAKDRNEMAIEDPMGYALMNGAFFHPYFTYNARIDSTFEGTFSLKFDKTIAYTHHARYLKDITLLGHKDTNVRANELDNMITGNDGVNTVIFSGKVNEYTIHTSNGVTTISDSILNRDGNNTVRAIEKLKFMDRQIDL